MLTFIHKDDGFIFHAGVEFASHAVKIGACKQHLC